MKLYLICLLLVANSLAAPDKTKRDAEFFGQFQLPELQLPIESGIVHHENHELAGHGLLRNENLEQTELHAPVLHEEYGVPHEEYGVPHEEYGVPQVREQPTTTPHYCPEEDFQAQFIPNPPEIPSFSLPEIPIIPRPKQEVIVPHEEYGIPHEEYGVPTTTLPPPPPPPTTQLYPYPAPTTTTLAPPPPPPPIVPVVREYPYPAPTTTTPEPTTTTPEPTTTTTTTTTAKPRSAPYPYPAKIKTSYGAVKIVKAETPETIYHHQPAVITPEVHFVQPKLVIHKKVVTFPLLKEKVAKFAKLYH